MRWYIKENKRAIACENFEGHRDDVEMSGEQVSGVIGSVHCSEPIPTSHNPHTR